MIDNAWAFIEGAPPWFTTRLIRKLAVEVPAGTSLGVRFGSMFAYQDRLFGSLVHEGPSVPSGLAWHVWRIAKAFEKQGHPVGGIDFIDRRERPVPAGPLGCVNIRWWPSQDEAHAKALAVGTGVIDSPPRSGKTLTAARLIDSIGLPALYVAPTVEIARQTHRVLSGLFGADRVARIDGTAQDDERDPTRFIVVATAASALRLDSEFYATRQVLVFDEFHHGAAESWHRISLLAKHVFHRFCFTGTHWRTAGDDLAMQAVCSRVVYSCSIESLVPNYIARPWVAFTSIRGAVPARDWRVAYARGIVEHEERNATVVRFAEQLSAEGVPTLVLTNRRAHADALANAIPGARVAKGGQGVLTSKSVADFVAGAYPVLVGTTVLGEGVDVPNAGAVIYAGGLGGSVQMMQSYFRCLTAAGSTTKVGRVYDFLDLHHQTLMRHAEERLALAQRVFPPGTVQVFG